LGTSKGIKPDKPAALPKLFALDTVLEIPDGFRYVLKGETPTGSALAAIPPGSAVTLDSDRRINRACHVGCGGSGCGGGCGG